MKLLLYCCKAKPYLIHESGCYDSEDMCCDYDCFSVVDRQELYNQDISLDETYNGKIVAECDYEVEEIRKGWGCLNGTRYFRNNVNHYYPDYELEKQSCLSFDELNKYLKGRLNQNCGYAIHIKNLNIFDEPKTLGNYYSQGQVDWIEETELYRLKNGITKAPQNMCYAYKYSYSKGKLEKYILISIRPEWLCKILNKEKTVEVRKEVLKEMLNNE